MGQAYCPAEQEPHESVTSAHTPLVGHALYSPAHGSTVAAREGRRRRGRRRRRRRDAVDIVTESHQTQFRLLSATMRAYTVVVRLHIHADKHTRTSTTVHRCTSARMVT